MANWWTASKRDVSDELAKHIELLSDRHRQWNSRIAASLRMYESRSGQYGIFDAADDPVIGVQERIRWNVIQSCVDTLHSKIASQKPRPKFLASGGSWDQRSKARQCDKFVEGIYHQSRAYDQASSAFWDALVVGIGAIKVFCCHGNVEIERVYPGEILVDDRLSHSFSPRVMCQVKSVPVEALSAEYPESKKSIELARSLEQDKTYSNGQSITIDTVEVYEAWHLPNGKDGTGRHVISTSKGVLLDEEYNKNFFPIVFLHFSQSPNGFYKTSLVEQLRPIQVELNKISQRIQDSMELNATSWTCIEEGSIEEEHLTNVPGTILKYRQGSPPPTIVTPSAMSGQVFQYFQDIYQRAYEISGISQLSASSKKPPEIESGKALRMMNDIQTERFAALAKHWEQVVGVDLAYAVMAVAEEEYSGQRTVKSVYTAKNFTETINWSEISDIDQFVIKAYPVNFLSQTPSGRLADLEQLINMGLISDPKIAAMYLDFPDLENLNDIETASVENTDRIIDLALYDGEYVPPRPYTNFAIAIPRISAALQKAETEGCPEERLDLLRQWLMEAAQMTAPPEPEAPPMGAPELGAVPPPPSTGPEAVLPPELANQLPQGQ